MSEKPNLGFEKLNVFVFGFQTFGPLGSFLTKLDHFICIKKLSRLAKTSENRMFGFGSVDQMYYVQNSNDSTTNDFEKSRNPNVRISNTSKKVFYVVN